MREGFHYPLQMVVYNHLITDKTIKCSLSRQTKPGVNKQHQADLEKHDSMLAKADLEK